MCLPQRQYTDVKNIDKDKFKIGNIGWFPILRPSLSASPANIHTKFGYICAKAYPVVIFGKFDDFMLGLIISTSNGNGLNFKGPSIKGRSVPVVTESSSISTSSDWGQQHLQPKRKLRVKGSSGYIPPTGAYVDMFNTISIPYDSRFQIEGRILPEDVLPMNQMRFSATLYSARPMTVSDNIGVCNWLGNWAFRANSEEALILVLQKMAGSKRLFGLNEIKKKA
ncbi:hypothetical protein G6011_08204 [Alternaria panax]|uniref:Uncharacterized protein n=1 Tax=Alternaria panax TaxID=48097 RepID=A0AAD4FI96_9PLEO|nr:hypothetical protein G6011_08204 [Alternaria panax]